MAGRTFPRGTAGSLQCHAGRDASGPNGGAVLRIAYLKAPLPTDRESLFWLNILEVPPRDEDENNALQFSFRSRFKLFFRPSQLKSVDSAAGKLQWKFLESGGAGKRP